MPKRLNLSYCTERELAELKVRSPSKIAADLKHYVHLSNRLFEGGVPQISDEQFTLDLWYYVGEHGLEVFSDYHS